MHHVREVLRLKFSGASDQLTSRSLGISRSTVAEIMARARSAGLCWPLDPDLTDEALSAAMFRRLGKAPNLGARQKPEPDWARLHLEMRRPHVTLMLLWEEYRAEHSDGYAYSRFCDLYKGFAHRLAPTMRQTHVAGEKLFVDFAGATIPVLVDPLRGVVRPAQIFVACLGASSYTYVEATWTQTAADWMGAQANALQFFGGAPQIIVPDNPKAAIAKSCAFEPRLARSYAEFAAHYGVAVVPARVRKPRDKAKVESGVQVAQRWIVARLRGQRFTSLAELNAAIAPLRTLLNQRLMRQLKTSRSALFEEVERHALRPLPSTPYEYAEWRKARVGVDYHVDVGRHFYSVPYRYLREEVDVRVTPHTVEIFLKGQRIAAHARHATCGRHTTQPDHMPESHRAYAGWTLGRFQEKCVRFSARKAAQFNNQRVFESKTGRHFC